MNLRIDAMRLILTLIFFGVSLYAIQTNSHLNDLKFVEFATSDGVPPFWTYIEDNNANEQDIRYLHLQNALRAIRRMKRNTDFSHSLGPYIRIVNKTRSTRSSVVVLETTPRDNSDSYNGNGGGRCVLSADQAVQFCGFAEEVSAPPIPPSEAGGCHQSRISEREICYPRYEQLDTTCTDASGERSSLVAPPSIPHATVRTMAFVPPDNLNRLIRQYYRQMGRHLHRNETIFDVENAKSFLFVKYHCEHGYELLDEVDTMFCQNRQWVQTNPVCRGKGLCEKDNGGCSHSCLSRENQIECYCPKGMVLDSNGKNCIKPVPKNLCRKLAGCKCSPIDVNVQYACACQKEEDKCLLLRGAPKIYLEPNPPFEVEPGGNLNITCAAVSFPFPKIYWQRENEEINSASQKTGTVKSEQVLMIKEIYKNTEFTCHAENEVGATKRVLNVIVTGPGSAPILRAVNAARTSIQVQWDPPHTQNRPVTSYDIYYTENPLLPLRDWQRETVLEPNHDGTVNNLKSDTTYTIRIRANDNLGPGKLSNPVSISTQKAAKRPLVHIVEGDEFRVAPKTPFSLGCNVTRGDPTPSVQWESRGRPISSPQESRIITLEHVGLYENTEFLCVAENEAGKTSRKVDVIITGPTAPERIRYHVDGEKILLQWEPPRITNGEMKDYEILYTDDPTKPESEWQAVNTGGPDVTSTTLTNLRELTNYTVKVRGENINGVGLPSLNFTVKTWLAPRKPTIKITPSEELQIAPNTNELTIVCNASGVPRPKIVWLWNNTAVDDGKDGFRIYDVTPISANEYMQSKLQIQNTTRTGSVECQAINEQGVDTKNLPIIILGPGSPPESIHPTSAQDGFHVHWRPPTIPNGKINKYVIYYTKDPDLDLADWATTTIDGDNVTSAIIPNQEEDTSYFVRIQAVNDNGPGIISDSYEVKTGQKHIPLKATLVIIDPGVSEEEETLVEPHQIIRFKCIVEGRPKPNVFYTWIPFNDTKSGQEPIYLNLNVLGEPALHRYETDVTETSSITRRLLSCEARNIHGSASDNHIFNVIKPGTPPEEISPLIDLDNHVTIGWKPTIHPNGNLTKYHVYLSADPSKPLDQWQRFNANVSAEPSLEFKRGDLEPETPYYVRIAAVNDDGEGPPSDVTHFMTQSGAPLDAPSDVMAEVAPDNSVNISWTGPSQPNGDIKAYTIYFTPEDPGELEDDIRKWTKIVVPTTDDIGRFVLDKNVHGLLPDHDYKVRISATNDQSEGPLSGVTRFTTGSGEVAPTVALYPPENLATVLPQTNYSVNCTTTGIPPPTVFWKLGDFQHIPGPVLHLEAILKDTTATCIAENNVGKAQVTLNVLVKGPGTPPNEIVSIPMISPESGEQEVNVEWATPDEPNGKLTNYIVHYGIIPDGELEPREWQQLVVEPDKDSKKLPNLLPKSKYSIKVQAVSDRGPGVMSAPHTITTLPLPPRMPEVPRVSVYDNNTVEIEFKPADDPEDPTGTKKIKDYKIIYTTGDPTLENTKWKELIWTLPDDDLNNAELGNNVRVPIDGENFDPETGYTVKLIPRGEIDGLPTDPVTFQTTDGIIPPSTPVINIEMPPNNTIRVPAGTDYTVSCKADGFPPPNISWFDADGQKLSENSVLRLYDIKVTQRTKCVAQNTGGSSEIPFNIYVAGPGNAPGNIRLSANKPKTIDVHWNPPTLPNGKITRYIIYYIPLDDQDKAHQVGQVPSKPVSEWLTYHAIGDKLNEGEKHVLLTDFITPDTSYAVIVQAANEDGPGPYSEQNSIRTMSKVREHPPKELRVEPLNQTSAMVRWKPAEGADQAPPIGYELYYIVGDRKIEEDEFLSLPKWTKIEIPDGNTLSHLIKDELTPDTEYVMKIRAIYDSGPGVFSKPCITKTLPEGDIPFIVVSAGVGGIAGTSEVNVFPGSAYNVFCKASGRPLPSVKWIRGGNIPIDPSTVKSEDSLTKWSLNVANLTEDTIFMCVAHNQIGVANWTIKLNLIKDLPPDWETELVTAENHNGEIVLKFSDKIPEYLKNSKDWILRYTNDPSKPIDAWRTEESNDRALDVLSLPGLEPGVTYYIAIENPTDGIRSPAVPFLVPKLPSDIRVSHNINNDIVLSFRPAISSTPVKKYTIAYWPPSSTEDAAKTMDVSANSTTDNILSDLPLDTEQNFRVTAHFSDGSTLLSDSVIIFTPAEEIKCNCSHFCRLVENESGKVVRVECSCPEGYELQSDEKTCLLIEDESKHFATIQISSTFNPLNELDKPEEVDMSQTNMHSSPLPTDSNGQTIHVTQSGDERTVSPYPTDELGREIRPIVFFNGSALATDGTFTAYDPDGRAIIRDDDQQPIGPDGKPLAKNDDGNFIYPPLDKFGVPLPTDENYRPIYRVANADGIEFSQNSIGLPINEDGHVIPTDKIGQPIGPDGSPLPTDYYGRFIVLGSTEKNVDQDLTNLLPTDAMGYPIFPIVNRKDELLPTSSSGMYLNENGEEIEKNEQGIPLDENRNELTKNLKGEFVWIKPAEYVSTTSRTDETKKPVIVIGPDGQPRPTDSKGHFLGLDERPIPTDSRGRFLDINSERALEKNKEGNYILPTGKISDGLPDIEIPSDITLTEFDTTTTITKLPTDDYGNGIIVDENGKVLPTDNTGQFLNKYGGPIDTDRFGRPIDSDSGGLLPQNNNGEYIYKEKNQIGEATKSTIVVDSAGIALPKNMLGQPIKKDGSPVPTDSLGRYLMSDGSVIAPNSKNEIVISDEEHTTIGSVTLMPITTIPSVVIYSFDNNEILPTNSNGRFLNPDGELIPIDEYGRPLDNHGQILPTNSKGEYVYKKSSEPSLPSLTDAHLRSTQHTLVRGPDGMPQSTDKISSNKIVFPTDETGKFIFPIVDENGILLKKDSSGKYIDFNRNVIPLNEIGHPLDNNNEVLPTNHQGNYVYRKEFENETPITKIKEIIGMDGKVLPTNSNKEFLDANGNILPTNKYGEIIGTDGLPLPTDTDGIIKLKEKPQILPTDDYGRFVYPIVRPDGVPLPTNANENYINEKGEVIQTDDFGHPLDNEGKILPTNSAGDYVYTDSSKNVIDNLIKATTNIKAVIGPDGIPFSTDNTGRIVDHEGYPIPTNSENQFIGPDGQPLPIDHDGNSFVELDANLPTDNYKKVIQSVVDENGKPISIDSTGRYLDQNQNRIPTDIFGRPLTNDGDILPTNSDGLYVFVETITSTLTPTEVLSTKKEPLVPTDNIGRKINAVVSPDGSPLPQDAFGKFVNAQGQLIEVDNDGRPLNEEGNILPTNSKGEFIYMNPKKQVLGQNGELLPTDNMGAFLDFQQNPISTNSLGDYIDMHGSPLPTNNDGAFVYSDDTREVLPTDSSGKIVHSVVDSYGIELPKDSSGRHVDPDGEQISTDEFGKPLDDSGNILPTEASGKYVYTRLFSFPTTVTKRPIVAVDHDGQILPTDHAGNVVDRHGSAYPTNIDGLLIGPNGSPLPTNADGASIVDAKTHGYSGEAKILPTDDTGKIVHPIVGEDGELLPTDNNGRFVGFGGETIPLDDQGRPLKLGGADSGEILPTNSNGEFIYANNSSLTTPAIIDPWDYEAEDVNDKIAYPKDSDRTIHSINKTCRLRASSPDIIIAINNDLLQDYAAQVRHSVERLLSYHLNMSPDVARVGIIQYGKGVQIPINLGGYHELAEVLSHTRRLKYSRHLGVPEIYALYSAAAQQFRSFGRTNAVKLLLIFTTGDDINTNTGPQLLKSYDVSTILIGLKRYDTEIQDESPFNVLLDKWETPQLAARIARFIEGKCREGSIILSSSLRPMKTQDDSISSTIRPTIEPEEIIIDETKKSDQLEKCAKLQTRTRLVLVVETSDDTEHLKSELQRLLHNFLRNYVEKTGASLRIGIIYYGKTADVAVDIGNYANIAELEGAVDEMHFISGGVDSALAIRTARQLFDEQRNKDAQQDESLWKTESSEAEKKEKDAKEKAEAEKKHRQEIKIVFHVHKNPLSAEAISEAEKNRREIGAAIINFDEAKWRLLESAESFWRNQICLMQSMVDMRLGREDAASASADLLSDTFFRGPDASPLPTDESGHIIVITTSVSNSEVSPILPTDDSGKFVYPVVNEDGKLMPTDAAGRYIDATGDTINTDDFGHPIDEKGEILPVNHNGEYVLLGPRGNLRPASKPTSRYGDSITIIGADGIPVPTDSLGHYVNRDNTPLSTNYDGLLIDSQGKPLSTNAQQQIVVNYGDYSEGHILPTDDSGRFIYPIVYKNGKPLRTDSSGRYIDAYGDLLPTDDFGRPLDEKGNLLPTNKYGQYIYPHTERPVPQTTSSSTVTQDSGQSLPTNEAGQFVDELGHPLPTTIDGYILRPDGSPFPTSNDGKILTPESKDIGRQDKYTTDSSGRIIHTIVDKNGILLKTDINGRYVDENNEPIELNESGHPLDQTGKILPKNSNGQYVYAAQQKVVAIGPDGLPLATDSSGRLVDHLGHPYPTDHMGVLVGENGSPLPTNVEGEYVVLPEDEVISQTLPTDHYGKNIYPIVDAEGRPLPTDTYGHYLDKNNQQIATNEFGHPVDDEGEVLTINSHGEYIYRGPKFLTPQPNKIVGAVDINGRPLPTDNNAEKKTRILPTDEYGKIIYPIVRPDGHLLPKDESGRFMNARGEIIPIDDFGRPLNEEGYPLPINKNGDYVYVTPEEKYVLVGSDGQPLPTDSFGRPLNRDDSPIPTDEYGHPIFFDGSPLSTNPNGEFVFTDDERRTKVPIMGPDDLPQPTNNYGKIIEHTHSPTLNFTFDGTSALNTHSGISGIESTIDSKLIENVVVINEDGVPLSKNENGQYVDLSNNPIKTDVSGKPLDNNGLVLAQNSRGEYVYPDYLLKGEQTYGSYNENESMTTLSTDHQAKITYTIVDSDGNILPKNEEGRYLTSDVGDPVPIDNEGRPLNAKTGELLPTNSAGDYIYVLADDNAATTDPQNDYYSRKRNDSIHCFIDGFIELLFVIDSSNNVKILDYRLMKEAVKDFLSSFFDLRTNRVRVGALNYGDNVNIPIALGDYDTENELLTRIGETRRLKGNPNLGDAFRESANEFSLSGTQNESLPPRIVIVWKNGNSSDRTVRDAAENLRTNHNANIFVVTVAEINEEDLDIVGKENVNRVVQLSQWRNVKADDLGNLADQLCKISGVKYQPNAFWPLRRPSTTPTVNINTQSSVPCMFIDYKIDLIIILDSSNFDQKQFSTIVEGVGTLVDESFDLAPDVVRIGFIVYSDKVSVPIALGHYEDKIELLEKIVDAEKLNGSAIALLGLEAARQQFQLHGRKRDEETNASIARVILFITNGKHRGNAANVALEMREKMDVQIFAVTVGPSQSQYASLSRIVGRVNAAQRLLKIDSVNDLTGERLSFVRHQLCLRIQSLTGVLARTTKSLKQRNTRDTTHILLNTKTPIATSSMSSNKAIPICQDGFLRPYIISVIVDVTSRASQKDFKLVIDYLLYYLKSKFGTESQLLRLNLITVDFAQISYVKNNTSLNEFSTAINRLKLNRHINSKPAKLITAINKVFSLADEQYIPAVNLLTIIISTNGLSSDANNIIETNHPNYIVAISIKNPASDLLKNLSKGSSNRVIHFGNWSAENVKKEFKRQLSFAICEKVIFSKWTTKAKFINGQHNYLIPHFSTKLPKWKSISNELSDRQPTNVILTPINATALAVSWKCCSDQDVNYVIIYSSDANLPKQAWNRVNATCNDASGVIIDALPTEVDYHACVVSMTTFSKLNDTYSEDNCDMIYLDAKNAAEGARHFLELEKRKTNMRQLKAV